MRDAMPAEIEITEFLFCPHCGKKLFDFDKQGVKKCPHVVFAYSWGDSYEFIHARKDYAQEFVKKLKASVEYKEALEEEEGEAIDPTSEERFIAGKFEHGDGTSTRLAQYGNFFHDICSDNTIIFCSEGDYSGVHIAVDLGE